jgi:hypothetical protein
MAARETASNCPSRYGCVGLAESLRQRLPDAHQPNFAGGNGKPAVAFEATEEIARRVQASLARQPQPARVSYRAKRIRFASGSMIAQVVERRRYVRPIGLGVFLRQLTVGLQRLRKFLASLLHL